MHSCFHFFCVTRVVIAEQERKRRADAIDEAGMALLGVLLDQQKSLLGLVQSVPGTALPAGIISPAKEPKKLQ